jgi:lysylphosphatidylglycerol synthetase-like protein (DUF2156 family)
MISLQLGKRSIVDVLPLITVGLGFLLIIGGLSIAISSMILIFPAQSDGIDSRVELVILVMDLIPGVPLSFNELTNASLTTIGVVAWITGVDLILVGLGLRARGRFAKWIAMVFFGSATLFNIVTFLKVGLLGSFTSFVGIFVDSFFVYSLSKSHFRA